MQAVPFVKMHGLGNDFIVVFQPSLTDLPARARAWCDRHQGIGADGLLVLSFDSAVADARMRIFNADGSEVEMCGNGARCAGKYLYDKGLVNKTVLTLETLAGVKTVHLHPVELDALALPSQVLAVTVEMGRACPLPVDGAPFLMQALTADGASFTASAIDVGNPHLVLFADGDVERFGPVLEHDPRFPDGVNVEFVQTVDAHTLRMKVWERGCGRTLACATGACAAVTAAALAGKTAPGEVCVEMEGGNLSVAYDPATGCVAMTGPAATVFEGVICD